MIFLFFAYHVFGQSQKEKIDVQIADGVRNHDWKQTTFPVKTIIEKSGLFSIDVSTKSSEPDNKTTW